MSFILNLNVMYLNEHSVTLYFKLSMFHMFNVITIVFIIIYVKLHANNYKPNPNYNPKHSKYVQLMNITQ